MQDINFTTATHRQMANAGCTWTVLPSAANRKRRSKLGVKPSANKKGVGRASVGKANQAHRGVIG